MSDIEVTPKRWLALRRWIVSSSDQGKTWTGGAVMGKTDFVSVESEGDLVVAATRTNVLYSNNAGTTWQQAPLSSYITSIHGVTVTPEGQILMPPVRARSAAQTLARPGNTW